MQTQQPTPTPPSGVNILRQLPTGKGIVFGRTATHDREQAEQRTLRTADQAAQLGKPRLVVAAWGRSGIASLDDRDDLLFLLDQASQPWCEWIAVIAPDRLARSTQTAEEFVRRLREHGVALYVVDGSTQSRSDVETVVPLG